MVVALGIAGSPLIFPAIYCDHGAIIYFCSKNVSEIPMKKKCRKFRSFDR